MASYNKFNTFVYDLTIASFNFGSDTLKVMLTNSAPVATNSVYANLTDLSTANGYTAGGTAASLTSNSQTSGTEKLVLGNVTFTATGAIGPFRYAVLYDTTASGGPLIGWWDYGSSVTMASGDTFTVQFDATNGVLQIT